MTSHRYAPEFAFPAYAFVPGRHPHPVTDPHGHSFGKADPQGQTLNPSNPGASREFLFAVDLFNAGYYWEAHETWEGLWVAAGRTGVVADFLKGLIKLAAAGVKAREGQANGVQRHATRAAELLRQVVTARTDGQTTFAGVNIEELLQQVSRLASQPIVDDSFSQSGRPVLPFFLTIIDG